MTANLALDYNREVFGVPGPVNSPKSRGSNRLIKDGAVLVECATDVTSALGLEMGAVEAGGLTAAVGTGPDEKAVLEVLGARTLQIDTIIEKTGFSISKAAALLLDMEIKGLVVQRPGKCFVRRI
jgi:DNA processing protein